MEGMRSKLGGRGGGQLDFVEMGEGCVDGGEVLGDNGFAALAVGLLDGLLDLLDGFIARQHAADGEEAGLHDGVDAGAHAGFAGYGVAIDDIELDLLAQHALLGALGELVPDFGGRVGRVEQEDRAGHGCFKHVHLLKEAEVVAGDEAGLGDEVAGADWVGPEAQVRGGHGAGLLGVVDEVALRVVGCFAADDLDGVFVGADGAVGAEPVEESADGLGIFGGEVRIVVEAGVAYVVVDADGEVILGGGLCELVEDALDHGGRELLGGEAVAAADDLGHGSEGQRGGVLGQDGKDVLIERLAGCAGLLAAIERGDGLDGFGQCGEEGAGVEGPDRGGL